MATNNIMVGFEGLSNKQASKLLAYGEKHELQVVSNEVMQKQSEPTANAEPPKRRGRPPKKANDGTEIILPRAIINAAKKYADLYGNDAKKTVCEHFGATTVTGINGIPETDYREAMEIFQSDEEFVPDESESDDDDTNTFETKKNKKDKKKKKKDKGDTDISEVEITEPEPEKKKEKKKKKKNKDK